jgi:hypothetical protein
VGGAAWRCKVSIYAATVIGSMSSRVPIPGARDDRAAGA